MKKIHDVKSVHIEKGMLCLVVDGKPIEKKLIEVSPTLARASVEEQKVFEISPSGYGIYWSLIDEDISINGLLGSGARIENIARVPHAQANSSKPLPPAFNEVNNG